MFHIKKKRKKVWCVFYDYPLPIVFTLAVTFFSPLSLPLSSQVKAALEALDPIHKVQVRRCDESNGNGGSGGWLGGCPYGSRNGFSWEVLFESSYYENQVNSDTGAYQVNGQHKYIDEAPLSLTKSSLSEPSLLNDIATHHSNVESVIISGLDTSTNLMTFASFPSFKLVPKMKMVIKPSSSRLSGEQLNDRLPIVLTVVEVKDSTSVIITSSEGLSSSLIGQDIFIGSHWTPQVGRKECLLSLCVSY
jgi:hypothetical protein